MSFRFAHLLALLLCTVSSSGLGRIEEPISGSAFVVEASSGNAWVSIRWTNETLAWAVVLVDGLEWGRSVFRLDATKTTDAEGQEKREPCTACMPARTDWGGTERDKKNTSGQECSREEKRTSMDEKTQMLRERIRDKPPCINLARVTESCFAHAEQKNNHPHTSSPKTCGRWERTR